MSVWLERKSGSVYVTITRPGAKKKRKRVAADTPEGWAHAEAVAQAAREHQASDTAYSVTEAPVLMHMASRYLREDVAHLAPTTRGDRAGYLREGGVLASLMQLRMDAIGVAELRGWWGTEIECKRADRTGRAYLDVLQGVYAYALDLGLVSSSPVPAFRVILRRHGRTKGGRAEIDRSVVRPLTSDECARMLDAARLEGQRDHLMVLLGLDAGLRLGEILGLRWGHVAADALLLDETSNRPRGGKAGPPKSGRGRRVELSRRLARAIEAYRSARWSPSNDQCVIPGVDPHNWRKREWRRICTRACVGQRRIHDLRDTYASHLVSAGFPLLYVSKQLGHSDVSTTARHYARWVHGDSYVAPPTLAAGEVPADILARIGSLHHEATNRPPKAAIGPQE